MEEPSEPILLPRITIQFCTQCKWMLRAAYFAQELLSTFSTSLGEVALQPSSGGTFIVHLYHAEAVGNNDNGLVTIKKHLLWDRKTEGGFPETKELKRRVRDIIDPSRNLGHVDGHNRSQPSSTASTTPLPSTSLPKAIKQNQEPQHQQQAERKSTPIDIDPASCRSSIKEMEEGNGGKACEDCG